MIQSHLFLGMNTNNQQTKDFFASPALSLSLAGVFRNAPTPRAELEDGDEGTGGCGYEGEPVEISSENTGPREQSDDAEMADASGDEDGTDGGNKKKRRKNYHRHTAEQIRVMEALFKESPHPDEKQRQQLSRQLGLSARQVKFWFQNRRTQIKAIQERHENSLLKSEMEKLREENRAMREAINKACCPSCGSTTMSKDGGVTTEEQQLRIENASLRAEIEKLRGIQGKAAEETASPNSSCSMGSNNKTNGPLENYKGLFGLEKSRILEIVEVAMDELIKMASSGEPLWVRSIETGRDILNYDEYLREFAKDASKEDCSLWKAVEASRESGVVFLEMNHLVQAFFDVKQWKSLLPCMVAKAITLDVICAGDVKSKDGIVQLMFVEHQMLTPLVPTRELYFIRYGKKLSAEKWAILDVSVPNIEKSIDASLVKCRKNPSGCIIEDKANGHCKVTWVEHTEWQKSTIPAMYRSVVLGGQAFGARHWMATLQQQCERIVFCMATNVPTKDSNGISTLAGRKSMLKLAHRLTTGFFSSVSGSRHCSWQKLSKGHEEIRFMSRKNINEPGEPQGLIACAVLSTAVPISPLALFEFLRDESRRCEWDIMLSGEPTETIVNLAKGQDRGNCTTVHAPKSKDKSNKFILQDSSTNSYESVIAFAQVDADSLKSVMTGCDSSGVSILASGFAILPDGLESKPVVITTRNKDEKGGMEGGSLLTIGFQILANPSPTANLTAEKIEAVTTLVSCTLHNIKKAMRCEIDE
ncbi:Homeobox leucine zipper protein [Rhynchospora pubera]|uniref:Homeobox leucine zipper protein n=1 Tax=Rhynchospora pubera TaxID=906938 RepID=A0AAV8EJX5_9POAL|nr:Homeobox leucine zipper protein [Rhynchospora pubera]